MRAAMLMIVLTGCGPGWEAVSRTNTGGACLEAPSADAAGTVTVDAGVCLSSSCDRDAFASCSAVVDLDTNTITMGTPGAVEDEVREAIEILAPDSGFIIGPGCAIGPEAPPDNIHALVEAAHRYGTYPV